MGRYFTGMIDGKFWFGLQSSVAADRFGVSHCEPSYVEYFYTEDDLEAVNDEINVIKDNLGDKKYQIDDFFKSKSGYTDHELKEAGIGTHELSEYADLLLGIQIRDCIVENGECVFQAEL